MACIVSLIPCWSTIRAIARHSHGMHPYRGDGSAFGWCEPCLLPVRHPLHLSGASSQHGCMGCRDWNVSLSWVSCRLVSGMARGRFSSLRFGRMLHYSEKLRLDTDWNQDRGRPGSSRTASQKVACCRIHRTLVSRETSV